MHWQKNLGFFFPWSFSNGLWKEKGQQPLDFNRRDIAETKTFFSSVSLSSKLGVKYRWFFEKWKFKSCIYDTRVYVWARSSKLHRIPFPIFGDISEQVFFFFFLFYDIEKWKNVKKWVTNCSHAHRLYQYPLFQNHNFLPSLFFLFTK